MDIDLSPLTNIFSRVSDIKNNLTSTDTDKPLSAAQGKELKRQIDEIDSSSANVVDTLTSLNNTSALSAKQGRILESKKVDFANANIVQAEVTYEDDSTETLNLLTYDAFDPDVLKVILVWIDEDDESSRPASVTARMMQDGVSIQSYILDGENGWQTKDTFPLTNHEYEWQISGINGYGYYIHKDIVNKNLTIFSAFKLPDDDGDIPPAPGNDTPTVPERS